MKKTLAFILCLLFLSLSVFPVSAAELGKTYSEGYFYYQLRDGSVHITGYFGRETEAVVPAAIGGYPVNVIESGAFQGTTLKKLTLPDCIVSEASDAYDPDLTVIHLKGGTDATDISIPADNYDSIRTDDGFTFSKSGGGFKLTAFAQEKLPENGELTIPSGVLGLSVTEVMDNVFFGIPVKVLRVPSSVKITGSLAGIPKVILNYDTQPIEVSESAAGPDEFGTDEAEIDMESLLQSETETEYVYMTEDGLLFRVTENGAVLIGYDKTNFPENGKVVVPAEIDGKKVVSVENGALKGSGLQEIELRADVDTGALSEDVEKVVKKTETGDGADESKEKADKKLTVALVAALFIVLAIIGAVGIVSRFRRKMKRENHFEYKD